MADSFPEYLPAGWPENIPLRPWPCWIPDHDGGITHAVAQGQINVRRAENGDYQIAISSPRLLIPVMEFVTCVSPDDVHDFVDTLASLMGGWVTSQKDDSPDV